jgi:hypothetical protein
MACTGTILPFTLTKHYSRGQINDDMGEDDWKKHMHTKVWLKNMKIAHREFVA